MSASAQDIVAIHDLVTTESFHRKKRSLLIFTGLLTVIGVFAAPGDEVAFGLNGTTLTADVERLALLLLAAATYYLVGLALEIQNSVRLNSELAHELRKGGVAENTAAKALDQMLVDMTDRFEQLWQEQDAVKEAAQKLLRTAPRTDKDLTQFLASALVDSARMQREMRNEKQGVTVDEALLATARPTALIVRDVLKEERLRVAEVVRAHQSAISKIIHRSEAAIGILRDIRAQATALKKSSESLRKDLGGWKRADFWIWEIGGAAVAMGIAVAWSADLLLALLAPR